jgi:hypothetical protein
MLDDSADVAPANHPRLDLEGKAAILAGKAITPFSAIAGVTEEAIPQRRVSGG